MVLMLSWSLHFPYADGLYIPDTVQLPPACGTTRTVLTEHVENIPQCLEPMTLVTTRLGEATRQKALSSIVRIPTPWI